MLIVLPAQCAHGCKHGECVGPNKCKCFPGYTGKTCNQGRRLEPGGQCGAWQSPVLHWFQWCLDLNECGLKPRPCEHRCMNSYGSYKCYCLNGYALTPDGSCTSEWHPPPKSKKPSKPCIDLRSIFFVFEPMCSDSRTCSLAHCQYGCEEVQGEIRCLCPSPGLQLGEDERTCVGEERRVEPFCWFPIFWLSQWVWEKTVFWLQPSDLISEPTLFGPVCLQDRDFS